MSSCDNSNLNRISDSTKHCLVCINGARHQISLSVYKIVSRTNIAKTLLTLKLFTREFHMTYHDNFINSNNKIRSDWVGTSIHSQLLAYHCDCQYFESQIQSHINTIVRYSYMCTAVGRRSIQHFHFLSSISNVCDSDLFLTHLT